VRPTGSGLRGQGGRWTATEETMEPTGRIGQAWNSALRFLIGKRLETEAEGEERVGVATGLPILASDNISSSAYATEEAMRVLALAGTAALALTMPIAMYGLVAFGLFRVFTGDPPAPVTPPNPFPQEGTGPLTLLLVLRAFASGSVGLTGSEAVANGVPSFRRPEETNAIKTLVLMGT